MTMWDQDKVELLPILGYEQAFLCADQGRTTGNESTSGK